MLSCADSRVSPEIIFDQGLGDIFTVRNGGHVPSPVLRAAEAAGKLRIVPAGYYLDGRVQGLEDTDQG
ncbi:MAG: carbonic anhydrase [Bowdeniella nasicola]|nr:carbonic anhydrase [Bowdeniella nasicola]